MRTVCTFKAAKNYTARRGITNVGFDGCRKFSIKWAALTDWRKTMNRLL